MHSTKPEKSSNHVIWYKGRGKSEIFANNAYINIQKFLQETISAKSFAGIKSAEI